MATALLFEIARWWRGGEGEPGEKGGQEEEALPSIIFTTRFSGAAHAVSGARRGQAVSYRC